MTPPRALFRSPLALLCFLIGLSGASTSSAHLLNMSEVSVTVDAFDVATVSLRLDLTRELGSDDAYYTFAQTPGPELRANYADLISQLTAAIALVIDGQSIPLTFNGIELPTEASLDDFKSPFVWPRTEFRFSAQLLGPSSQMQLTFQKQMTFEEPIALVMRHTTSGLSKSRWLVTGQRSPIFLYADPEHLGSELAELPPELIPNPLTDLPAYLILGFKHILPKGLDHLLFVLGIFLAARTRRSLIAQISLFTLAHTFTLALATYRVIEPPIQIVEIAIATSILWIGLENIWFRKQGALRYVLIAAFGLLHGMGFASALNGLELSPNNFLISLLSFNLGVELGQLTFIAILFLLLGCARGKSNYQQHIVLPSSLFISAVSAYWIIERL